MDFLTSPEEDNAKDDKNQDQKSSNDYRDDEVDRIFRLSICTLGIQR